MPNLRPKRDSKSRTATPLTTNPKDSPASGSETRKEKNQSSLDAWVEPPVKAPAPSFEDHGFARHGVLEGMAPLGMPPSGKLKAKLRSNADASLRRSHLGKNGNLLAGDDVASTPEMTPARELEQGDSDKPEEEVAHPSNAIAVDDDDDDDYVPATVKSSARSGKGSARNGQTKVNATPLREAVLQSTTLSADITSKAAQQRLQIAVNEAIRRSHEDNHPSVGVAVKQLHEAAKTSASLAEVLHNIIHQKANPEQAATFRQFIKAARKQFRRNKKYVDKQGASALSREIAAKSASAFTPSKRTSPKAAGAGNIPTPTMDPIEGSTVPRTAPNHGRSPALGVGTIPHSAPPARLKINMGKKSAAMTRSPRKRKLPSDEGDEVVVVPAPNARSATPAQPAQTPSLLNDDSSDLSDLSDVDEEIVQNGPPELIQVTTTDTSDGNKKSEKKKKRKRKGKKNNKSRPGSPKRFKRTANGDAGSEDDQIYFEKRKSMLRSFDDVDFPMSDVRFDEGEDIASSNAESDFEASDFGGLTSRVKQNGAARTRRNGQPVPNGLHLPSLHRSARDSISDLPSPALDSAASTPPTTPALVPPAKRTKLVHNTSQTARTKRSPVKNRVVPVAGIPHTGGGLRTLGPSDNDNPSPASDNDDFCSACRGPGEFLCCDGCPRAFHFICCDPPIQKEQVPQEAYYCHSCRARLGRLEMDGETESRTVLAPLFQQLEGTNVKAFVLPDEVRTHFEGVQSKADGAYKEPVKRIALSKSGGYAIRPDYLRLLDTQNKPILCCQCGESSHGERPLLRCDYCSTYWHLDCCDPPLANPPYISPEATQRDAWRCPRHIDHDLRSGTLVQRDLNHIEPVPRRVRKPKNAAVIEPVFARGTLNNGLIDIVNDADYQTNADGDYVWPQATGEDTDEKLDETNDLNNKVFRLPEKSLIVDFLDKVRTDHLAKAAARKEEERRAQVVAERHALQAAEARAASIACMQAHSIKTQQAALHLAQLANKEKDAGLSDTSIEALVLSLTAEAPKEVVDAISSAGPGPLTEELKAELKKIRELIDRSLGDN